MGVTVAVALIPPRVDIHTCRVDIHTCPSDISVCEIAGTAQMPRRIEERCTGNLSSKTQPMLNSKTCLAQSVLDEVTFSPFLQTEFAL